MFRIVITEFVSGLSGTVLVFFHALQVNRSINQSINQQALYFIFISREMLAVLWVNDLFSETYCSVC